MLRVVPVALAPAPFSLPQDVGETDLLAKYFRAVGDPTRLKILGALEQQGDLTVSALVAVLGESQPKVSNHLACLRWCGFVTSRREGRSVIYRVADGRVLELLDLARGLLADNAEHVAACHRVEAPC